MECQPTRSRGVALSTPKSMRARRRAGGSTVAVHLALETRRLTGQEVLLVDLDVNGGTVGFLMKIDQPYTVLDASLNLHRLDAADQFTEPALLVEDRDDDRELEAGGNGVDPDVPRSPAAHDVQHAEC